ncbi:MAG TPA: sugar phosphate isomerase/epimerase [Chitinophagaceae bacterium]
MYNRRKFIQLSGGAVAGVTLSSMTSLSLFSSCDDGKKIEKFGLQLYTLRDDMPKDPRGVLKQVASFGYKQIESYEGAQGMFWGMSHTDFKKYMDELGMTIISSHCDINKDFETKAAQAAEIGMKYLICPYKGPQASIDAFKKFADEFNQKGEVCKKNGIRFAYHNHDYSFKPLDGQLGQDVMMKNTDPALVDFELDMYWVAAAGQDIETWLNKYKGRFKLCHIKDRSKTPGTDNGKNSVNVGTGNIDWRKVLKTAKATGMEYFIVEQEAYAGTTPLKAAEADAAFMKKLKI